MNAMYRSFSAEHGLSLGNPAAFAMRRYREALDRIEQLHRRQFGAMTLVTTAKYALMRRFFELAATDPRVTGTAIQTVGAKGHDGLAILLVTSAP